MLAKTQSSGENGNALFLILIAVALFAALSYAVTQSGKSGGGGAGRELANLAASQVLQDFSAIEHAINKMMLLNGCTRYTLNFDHASWDVGNDYDNTGAPANGSCDVFGENGGGVTWTAPPPMVQSLASGSDSDTALATEYHVSYRIAIRGITAGLVPTEQLTLISRATRDMCIHVNNQSGITNPSGEPPEVDSFFAYTAFTGTYPGAYDYGNPSGHGPELAGHRTGCFLNTWSTDNGKYGIYHVLLAYD
ncbi:MAG: hypothetical protein OXT65_05585 [Alphaproteobacteria bacterium]|nr:hypothetical protein [Alphaproteobacteria bacterium]